LEFNEVTAEAVIRGIDTCDYTNLSLMQKDTRIVAIIKILPAKDYARVEPFSVLVNALPEPSPARSQTSALEIHITVKNVKRIVAAPERAQDSHSSNVHRALPGIELL
jgi:hypothetical protein